MVSFVAIDPSITSTGITALEVTESGKIKVIDIKTIRPKQKFKKVKEHETTNDLRLIKKIEAYEIFVWITENLSAYKDAAFFVFENYSYAGTGHLADLGEMNGMFKMHIRRVLNKPIDVVAPTSVKKAITGQGGPTTTKKMVQESLAKFIENYDEIKWNNFDESDAVAVGVTYALQMGAIKDPNKIAAPIKKVKKSEPKKDTKTSGTNK